MNRAKSSKGKLAGVTPEERTEQIGEHPTVNAELKKPADKPVKKPEPKPSIGGKTEDDEGVQGSRKSKPTSKRNIKGNQRLM
jgi:hypothetical protein